MKFNHSSIKSFGELINYIRPWKSKAGFAAICSTLNKIFDIAPESFESIKSILSDAKVILWNGPVGLFEKQQFMHGTSCVAKMIVNSEAYSVGGGGDTIAAAKEIGVLNEIDYMSTAGGAFLEFIEGRTLPAIEALELKALESLDIRT